MGTDSANHVQPTGDCADRVSAHHLKILLEHDTYIVYDLNSETGTFINGHRLLEAALQPGDIISLGKAGARYRFVVEEGGDDKNSVGMKGAASRRSQRDEANLQNAVAQARAIRRQGGGGNTTIIMRNLVEGAVKRTQRRWLIAFSALALVLCAVIIFGTLHIKYMEIEKHDIDSHILLLEGKLAEATDPQHLDKLICELEDYQNRAHSLQKDLLYQVGIGNEEDDFIKSEIKKVMREFGAPEYSIPPEFVDQVQNYIQRYQEYDRMGVERALTSKDDLDLIRKNLQDNYLPPDLAYMVLVESSFKYKSRSRAGAAGPWQFVPGTARAYGLKVSANVDERYDVQKSTKAASRYIRHLILEFGSGSSVMLALAAYNSGPSKVKSAIRRVEDPIRQRDFWYLYRMRTLPRETREYVPKIIAAIVIGRNPERFGFQA